MSRVVHEGEARPAVAGRSLFDYADDFAADVATSCGRTGRCRECVVEVTRGLDCKVLTTADPFSHFFVAFVLCSPEVLYILALKLEVGAFCRMSPVSSVL